MARVQLDVPVEQLEEMNKLMVETGISTKKDLINNALTLFEWAVNERKTGRSIGSLQEEEKVFKEILMPALAFKSNAKMVRNPN